ISHVDGTGRALSNGKIDRLRGLLLECADVDYGRPVALAIRRPSQSPLIYGQGAGGISAVERGTAGQERERRSGSAVQRERSEARINPDAIAGCIEPPDGVTGPNDVITTRHVRGKLPGIAHVALGGVERTEVAGDDAVGHA